MARKKSKTDQLKIAGKRLLTDQEVQRHLRVASVRLREAWSRASGRPASKAIGDKKVYAKVRDAASSLASAGGRLRPQPEPKHTGRKVVAGAAVAGGAAYAVKKKRAASTSDNGTAAATDQPVPAPTPPLAVS